MKPIENILHRIPLTPKLLLVTVLVGLAAWWVLDQAQSKKLGTLITESTAVRLDRQAQENRIRFDNYVAAYHQAVKLIASQKNCVDYVLGRGGSASGKSVPRLYRDVPPGSPMHRS